MLGQISVIIEYSRFFLTEIFQFLMLLDITQNYPSISIKFSCFQHLGFVYFGTWALLVNEVHNASFK